MNSVEHKHSNEACIRTADEHSPTHTHSQTLSNESRLRTVTLNSETPAEESQQTAMNHF